MRRSGLDARGSPSMHASLSLVCLCAPMCAGEAALIKALRQGDVARVRLLLSVCISRNSLLEMSRAAGVDLASASDVARMLRAALAREDYLEGEARRGELEARAARARALSRGDDFD